MQKNEIRVLFHNIRSAHNVGSMFRTSDAIGVSMVYISGYTPSPLDRFNRPVKEIAKTALGAENMIPWKQISDHSALIFQLKSEGFVVVGIEQDKHAVNHSKFTVPPKSLVIVGSEVHGLSQPDKDLCDVLIEIPMYGEKESLNVSVAFGVALYLLFGE